MGYYKRYTPPAADSDLSLGTTAWIRGEVDDASIITLYDRAALVGINGTISQVFAENGLTGAYSGGAGYRGTMYFKHSDYYHDSSIDVQVRIMLEYGTGTAPNAKPSCALFPATSISSGTVTVGTSIATATTGASAGANELGAAYSAWTTYNTTGFLLPTFNWDVAASTSSDTYARLLVQVRQST